MTTSLTKTQKAVPQSPGTTLGANNLGFSNPEPKNQTAPSPIYSQSRWAPFKTPARIRLGIWQSTEQGSCGPNCTVITQKNASGVVVSRTRYGKSAWGEDVKTTEDGIGRVIETSRTGKNAWGASVTTTTDGVGRTTNQTTTGKNAYGAIVTTTTDGVGHTTNQTTTGKNAYGEIVTSGGKPLPFSGDEVDPSGELSPQKIHQRELRRLQIERAAKEAQRCAEEEARKKQGAKK